MGSVRSRFDIEDPNARVEVTIHPSLQGYSRTVPRIERAPVKEWSELDKARFMSGHQDKGQALAAMRNGSTGNNHKKKDRMSYGVRHQTVRGIRTGRAGRQTGVFLGPDAQASDSYGREMRRIQHSMGSKGNVAVAFRN